MKMFLVFFGSFSLVFLSGCAVSHSRPGVISMSGALGSNVEMGYTEKSDVTVYNSYNLSMEVKLQVIGYPHWAFRGDGNDPILGTPPRPRVVWESKLFTSFPEQQSKTIPMDRIVLEQQFVVVLVTWYDSHGRYYDKASVVFRPGNPYYPWHRQFTPYMGQFGTALNHDAVTSW